MVDRSARHGAAGRGRPSAQAINESFREFYEHTALQLTRMEARVEHCGGRQREDGGAGEPLTIAYMGMYSGAMARAATTSDAFNAIAEPQRRAILTLLKGRERPVGDLARALRMTQPRASKHLRVLREVGLVRVRGAGQQRLYSLDARGLKPVHEWVGGFEQFWNESFDRLNTYVQELRRQEQADGAGR